MSTAAPSMTFQWPKALDPPHKMLGLQLCSICPNNSAAVVARKELRLPVFLEIYNSTRGNARAAASFSKWLSKPRT